MIHNSSWTSRNAPWIACLAAAVAITSLVVSGIFLSRRPGAVELNRFVSGTMTAAGTPLDPDYLVVTRSGPASTLLSWTNLAEDATSIHVRRATTPRGPFDVLATLAPTASNYGDSSQQAAANYYYLVSAMNAAGESVPTASNTFIWQRDYGGALGIDSAKVTSIASDATGGLFVAGRIRGAVDIDGTLHVTATTDYDAFLARLTPAGHVVWIKQIGGPAGNDEAVSVAVDTAGNVLAGGTFEQIVDFGSGPVVSAGFGDVWIGKYSGATGTPMWARTFGGTSPDALYSLAVDGTSVIATGYFQGSVNPGAGVLTSAGSKDLFLVRYTGANVVSWQKRIGGLGNDIAEGVAATSGGKRMPAFVAITGTFEQSVDFGNVVLTAAGSRDVFLARYTDAGAPVWAKRFGAAGGEDAHAIAINCCDNSFIVTGEFFSTIDLGCGLLTNVNSADAWLARFTADGMCSWAKQFGTTTSFGIGGKSVAVSKGAVIALTGSISGNVDLGNGPLVGNSVDPYVAVFEGDGAPRWSRRFTGPFSDDGFGINVDALGYVTFGGEFFEQLDLGGGPMVSPNPSGTDAFVGKYKQ